MIPTLMLLQHTPLGDPEMGAPGWTFMGLAWLFVIGLVAWCFARVIWGKKPS